MRGRDSVQHQVFLSMGKGGGGFGAKIDYDYNATAETYYRGGRKGAPFLHEEGIPVKERGKKREGPRGAGAAVGGGERRHS